MRNRQLNQITANIGLECANSSIYRCKGKCVGLVDLSLRSLLMKLQLASILALVSASALGAPTSLIEW
jgi:hypothetical protein